MKNMLNFKNFTADELMDILNLALDMKKNPEKAMMIAVNGMLPNNTVGRAALTRLRVYAGPEHNHAAQKPENYEI